MIKLKLDWREVLWWMQGGMAGSHLRWSVYEDMVDKVWKQCTEQERRNLFVIMRRDLGSHWRPDEWNGLQHMTCKGEGPWLPEEKIFDKTPWMYFRQVLARFDPNNQYTVSTVSVGTAKKHDTGGKIRAYFWNGRYYVGWNTYVEPMYVLGAQRLEIPDDGTT
jgi:hypothetical protein